MKCDWEHPLPFGDSHWVEKSDVEPLVRSVRHLLDQIYEFGAPVDSEIVEQTETALIHLTHDKNGSKIIQIIDPLKPWMPPEGE